MSDARTALERLMAIARSGTGQSRIVVGRARAVMIEEMAQLHMTEAELARDLHAVLERVREGAEVVVEENNRPVAVIRMPAGPGRPIAECIAIARAWEARLGYAPVVDAGFAADVQAAIDAHREPLDTSVWD